MTWYLVEAYSPPGHDLTETEARIDASIRRLDGVTHLASVLLPEDETCFHFFEAANRDTVAFVSETADLGPLRIVETVHSGHLG